jgi:hypothetical protein
MMIGVAILGLVIAFFRVYLPWIMWRARVDRVIDQKLAAPTPLANLVLSEPTFQRFNDLANAEYEDVLRGPRHFAERLFATWVNDADAARRAKSLIALRGLLAEAADLALAREFLDRVLRRAVTGSLRPPTDESDAVQLLLGLVRHLGLDDGQRAAILTRARSAARGPGSGHLLPFWVDLVSVVGGTAEMEYLLELEDACDPNLFTHNRLSPLVHSRSAALIDHIRRWLDDPGRALHALDYTILPYTEAGRRLLLDVVLESGRDVPVRRKAMRLLKRDQAGAELLLRACQDPVQRRVIGHLYGPDGYNLTAWSDLPILIDGWYLSPKLAEVKDPDDPRPELIRLRDYWSTELGSWPWDVVVRGLNRATWASMRMRLLKKGKPATEADRAVQGAVETYLAVARELSGRADISTPAEWDRWYHSVQPAAIPRAVWHERMLAHPELIAFGKFNDYLITPKRSLSPEVVEDYAKLARAVPPGARWRLGLTLLLYCDRTEEAPLLIDDIEQELRDCPNRFAERNTWPIRILSYRFGVNYFWDVDAWRRWWADYQREMLARPTAAAGQGTGDA